MIRRELSQLMKSWKLKFHHGWNIKQKSCKKNENFIQIKLMNDISHNELKARKKMTKKWKNKMTHSSIVFIQLLKFWGLQVA
jgi:hypothetical protein